MNERNRKRPEWTEFECPHCDAYNPFEDGFGAGDELFCNYCGAVLEVRAIKDSDPPAFKLVEG